MENTIQQTDQQLIVLYEQGNDAAFDELMSRSQGRLFSYILTLTSDQDTANDIFQETYIRAIQAIRQHRYSDNTNFVPWLQRIAHNLAHDYYRDNQHLFTQVNEKGCNLADAKNDIFNRLSFSEAPVEDQITHDQSVRELRQLVSRLAEPQRQIIEMRFFDAMSFKEISQQLGISINTALGRCRYALINLRRMAAGMDFSEAV